MTLAMGVPAANAAFDLQFKWWIDGAVAGQYTVVGTDLGNGMYNYSGSLFYLNPLNPFEIVNLDYNLNGKPDANAGASTNVLLSGNLAVENLFLNTIGVQLLVELPSANPLLPDSDMGGSAAIGLTTNADGGTLASVGGMPVWQALTDGTPVGAQASLFFDPFALSNSGLGSTSTSGNFGIPNPVAGGPINNTLGIDINFSLTPSDQASITSVVNAVPIPGPGVLAVLAAGLVIRRRRR
ncbi:MAG: hypothetical protein ACYSU7_04245 [Planctomycetota bacterium]